MDANGLCVALVTVLVGALLASPWMVYVVQQRSKRRRRKRTKKQPKK